MARNAAAANVFQAIACPTRRALLDTLARGESNVTRLVATVDVSQSAVSQQLAVLKSAGLVEERLDGRFRHYRLRVQPLREVDAWMGRYRSYLERCFDALGDVLDAMPDVAAVAAAADSRPAKRPHRSRKKRRRRIP